MSSSPDQGEEVLRSHLPDGTFDLILNLSAPIRFLDQHHDGIQSGANLIGGYRNSFRALYPVNTRMVSVIFQPGYSALFVKDKLGDIAQDAPDATDVFGVALDELVDRLRTINDIECIRDLVEGFLLKQLNQQDQYNMDRIAMACRQIDQHMGISVSELAQSVCMSERNFRRNFIDKTGYRPIDFIKIKRAKRLVKQLNAGKSLRQAARSLHYYDAPHLIRDFKLITRQSPAQFMTQLGNIDQVFLEDRASDLCVP